MEPESVEELKRVVLSTHIKSKEIIDYCRNYALKRYDSKEYFGKLIKIMSSLAHGNE